MSEESEPKQAVALGYDGRNAPKIVATGEGLIAEEIIALAKANGVYIHQDPHLSHFLQLLELGEEIPKELYLLIAELIAFVYMLDGKFPEQWNNMHKKIVEKA
ncbi:EscU/YscU/HrcU family type III secretion system export apparatus switch protein [Shewanella sp. NKUCC05_KAH]|uniref:EscU/YscU/HrcU family type III secretion system export apparatus switch protein n=1 Tax=Shewanella sp. NKUCC05_KAH TaxID=2842126 RepID=UPI001C5B0ABA|nr:EscU/YscU/HrcU family type III secretion system export apparatus switch protein [Shewanella sp. NKUCC05_KAH]MBW3526241.1 EscU/YscU/HrcU family type III secretion system export apparatus switch protein [Shewanella sp. NKUCC05_KAH]